MEADGDLVIVGSGSGPQYLLRIQAQTATELLEWDCSVIGGTQLLSVREAWANHYGVPQEAVLFSDEGDENVDLMKRPDELGWSVVGQGSCGNMATLWASPIDPELALPEEAADEAGVSGLLVPLVHDLDHVQIDFKRAGILPADG